jgi:CheY-like chemotaxis protein
MLNLKPILLVEDDRVDMMTFKRSLNDLSIKNEVIHTTNGEEALEYLRGEGNEQPCVIFLDLNMPKMSGLEFLKERRTDNELTKIPVVVLTTSDNERDIIESFEMGVAGYLVKPADYGKFVESMRTINLYWTLSRLPSEEVSNERCAVQSTAD